MTTETPNLAPPTSTPTPSPAPSAAPAESAPPAITKESVHRAAQSQTGSGGQAAQPLGAPGNAIPTQVTQPTQYQQEPQSQQQEAQRAPNGQFQQKAGYDLVDFSRLPPELRQEFEPRFKRLYGQVKAQDRNFETLRLHNEALERKILEFSHGQNVATARQRLAQLENQAAQAAQRGDWVTVNRLQRDIGSIETADLTPKPLEWTPPPAFSQDEQKYMTQWAAQRPYAKKGHPQYELAKNMGVQLFSHPEWKDRDVGEVLAEVDRVMGQINNAQQQQQQPQQRQPSQQQVLSNNSNVRPLPHLASSLSGDQKRVAERMYLRSGIVQTRAEAHKRYEQQLKLM